MIWGARLGPDLTAQAERLGEWQQNARLLRWSQMLVRAVLLLFITDRLKEPPAFTGTWDERNPLHVLERACLEWLRTKKLSILSGIVGGVLDSVMSKTWEETREGVLALAALECDEHELQAVRRHIIGLSPSGGTSWPQELLEMLYLTTQTARASFRSDPHVRKGWAFRLIATTSHQGSVAPAFALGIRYCEQAGLDIKQELQDTITSLDADLYVAEDKARVALDDRKLIQYSLVRKPRPGFEIAQKAQGQGGRISAGLPMLLEDVVYMPPPYLIRLLSGEVPIKPIARARSRKELHDLLSRDDSVVRVKMVLSGDISIDPTELTAYRDRLQAGLDWVKGCFPEIRANAEIVVSE